MSIFRLFRPLSTSDQILLSFLAKHFAFKPFYLQMYRQALIHKSVTKNRISGIRHSNERLEFLGDAILDAIVGHYIYLHYPDEHEGFLTKARSRLVSRKFLNKLADKMEITPLLVTDVEDKKVLKSLSGNALEAIIGAMYLQKGLAFTRKRIIRLIESHFDIHALLSMDDDYKSQVFQWAQKHHKNIEFSYQPNTSGNGFKATLSLDGKAISSGKGDTKKMAEHKASKAALDLLNT